MVYGIIYMITNTVNGKRYIGKTKSHYGKKPHGIEGRWKNHVYSRQVKKAAPLLCNAIMKYGEDSFAIEELLRCDLSKCDYFEKRMISTYNTTDRRLGYNIALGGKGRSVVHVPDEIRHRISTPNTDPPLQKGYSWRRESLNIYKVYKDGVLCGYGVQRRYRGVGYRKTFTNPDSSIDELKMSAIKWLEQLKASTDKDMFAKKNRYNRKQDLPDYIVEDGKGNYKVSVLYNGTYYRKHFGDKQVSKTERLKYATEWTRHIQDGNIDFTSKYDDLVSRSLPTNITEASRNNTTIGYKVKIIRDGKTYTKGFETESIPLQVKFQQALQWKETILNQLRNNRTNNSSKEEQDNLQPSS